MSLDALTESDRVALPAWVRLHFDRVRDRWVLLAPERVLFPCATSVTILEHVGPGRALGEVVTVLAQEFEAPRETISAAWLASQAPGSPQNRTDMYET